MSRISIKGKDLQFDWGMNIILAKHTGNDAITPLAGLNSQESLEAIAFSALSRVDEDNDVATSHDLPQVQKYIKSFSGKDIQRLNTAWDEFLYMDSLDEIELAKEAEQETEPKKKKR